ncbi:MAG: tRNA pseudouridine(55) synthase TruB [Deinococcales bacterium]|nr:tRNA pseudouridine(55) synthase TruB [Deinococcales bacterium]
MSVFILNKPLGLTSRKTVNLGSQALAVKKVGHAGTLDPLATGVLILLAGQATKLSPFLSLTTKRYLASVAFGASTLTLDAEGPILDRASAEHITTDAIKDSLGYFLSLEHQVPPQFSAIKQKGVPSYRSARKGQTINHAPRPAQYHTITLVGFYSGHSVLPKFFSPDQNGHWRPADHGFAFNTAKSLGNFPTAIFDLEVSAGTYARGFARDLGSILKIPSHLSGLLRTQAGHFTLTQAVSPLNLKSDQGLSLVNALPYPVVQLEEDETLRVLKGQRLPLQKNERHSLISPNGHLVAVAEPSNGRMRLLRVFSG